MQPKKQKTKQKQTKNNSLKDAQRTKGRCGESQENNVSIKWKYQLRDRKPKKKLKRDFGTEKYNE